MKRKLTSVYALFATLISGYLFLSSSSNPPNGFTGSPADGGNTCSSLNSGCHSGPTGTGNATITGLPATIMPSTTYPITVTITRTNTNRTKGGFQLMVLDGNDQDAGDLTMPGASSTTQTSGGFEYFEHNPAQSFPASDVITYTVNWVSPASAPNPITMYAAANLAGAPSSNDGDDIVTTTISGDMGGTPVTVNVTGTNVSCFGGNNGSATATPSGGTPPYSYSWSNGGSTQTINNLTAAIYFVTVTATSGGTATGSVTITQPATAVSVSIIDQENITCTIPVGSATAAGSGGSPGYTYAWSSGASGATVSLPAGTWTVTATDFNGCTSTTSVTITSNTTPPFATAGPPGTISCASPTTTLNGTGSTTGPGITYLWTGPGIISGANTLMPVVNAAGTYTLTVTNTDNGCIDSDNTTVTANNSPPSANAGANMTLTCTTPQVTLNGTGSSTGANFTYLWTGPGIVSGANTLMPVVNAAGTYTLTVTNTSNGCTSSDQAEVNSNTTAPTATAGANMTLTCTATQVTLNGSGSSSGANFSYQWTGPGIVSGGNTLNPVVNMVGTYTLTVTNNTNGCTSTDQADVNQNTTPPISNAGADMTLTCTTTQVTLNGNGSSSGANFTYLWTTSNGNIVSGANSPMAVVDEPGTYCLQVTNTVNGCTATDCATVAENITAPIANVASPAQLTCTTTQVTLNGSASSGSNLSFLWTTTNGNIVSGANTNMAVVNAAGTYTLTVTSGTNGCTDSETVSVSSNTTPPNADAGPGMALNCNVSSVVLNGSGSSQGGNFTYQWTGPGIVSGGNTTNPTVNQAGNYVILVTNSTTGCTANDNTTVTLTPAPAVSIPVVSHVTCNGSNNGSATASGSGGGGSYTFLWSNGANTAQASNLAAGTYTVTLTDADGCTATASVSITQPTVLLANATATNESTPGANDGAATANPTGGTPAYQYLWNTSATTQSITGLAPGNYSVTVTDANGCTKSESVSVQSSLCTGFGVSLTFSNPSCNNGSNGSATATPSGGMVPFTFAWSNSATTATVNNLAAGTFTVTVSDENGCQITGNVTLAEPPALTSSVAQQTNVACHGDSTGTASIAAEGGTAGYNFSWSNGASGATQTNLPAGAYIITTTDANGCTTTISVNITQPAPLAGTLTAAAETSVGANDGTATVATSGGVPPYIYMWSNGASTSTITNLPPAEYCVSVTDANGCVFTSCATVQAFNCGPISAAISSENSSCFGNSDGMATVVATGFTNPTYLWSNNSTGATIGNLPAGTYSVTVSDDFNCTASASVNITQPAALAVELLEVQHLECPGQTDGLIRVNGTGGTPGYAFIWSNGAIDPSIFNLGAGNYEVTLSDANDCTATFSQAVDLLPDTEPPVAMAQNFTIFLDGNGSANITPGMVDAGSSDNCGLDSIAIDQSNFDCADVGENLVILGVVDAAGNFALDTALVTILDNILPALECPSNITITGDCNSTVTYETPLGSDNCGNVNVFLFTGLPSGSVFPNGTSEVTWAADDNNGNTVFCTFNVTVQSTFIATGTFTPPTCADFEDATATITATGGVPPYGYEWNDPLNQQTQTAIGLAAGEYHATVTDANGCVTAATIVVIEPEALKIGIEQVTPETNNGMNGAISVNLSGGTGDYLYEWTLNGSFFSNLEDLTGLDAGIYVFQVTDAVGCTVLDTVIVESILDARDFDLESRLSLQPNPTNGKFFVQLDLSQVAEVNIAILDLTGRPVQLEWKGSVLRQSLAFDLSNQPPGVYLLRLVANGMVAMRKVVLN